MKILSLGEKIKTLRKSKDMTLKELAGDRITAAQISHIERDKSHTSYELLEYIAERLDVTTDYLLETKEMQAKKITDNLIMQSEIFIKNNNIEKAKESVNKAVEICIEHSISENYARGHFLLGEINLKQNNKGEAVSQFEKAVYYFIKSNDNENVFRCYYNIGDIYIKEEFYKGALLQLEIALRILKNTSIEDTSIYKDIYSSLAFCSIKIKDTNKTEKYIAEVEELEVKEDKGEKIDLLMLKANELFNLGQFDKSKQYFSRILDLINKGEVREIRIDYYLRICETYKEMKDYENLSKYSKKIYEMKQKDEDEYMVESIFNIIYSCIMLDKIEEAMQYCKIALTTAIKKKNKVYEYKVLEMYSNIYNIKGNIDSAIQYLTKSLEKVKVIDDKKRIAELYIKLGELNSKISQEKELEYYRKGIEIYKKMQII